MYLVGKGHEHLGPGTSMVQRINWTVADQQRFDAARKGMGCSSCNGCAKGMGLFDSGIDFSGWGPVEWIIVAGGGYMLLSTVFTTQRAATRVRKGVRKMRRRRAAAAA